MAVPELITSLLDEMVAAGVEFIVVGGAAGVLHGAPVTTKDLDIVHRRSPENIARLMKVLEQVGAHFWPDPAQRRLPPRDSDLAGHGQLNLQTRLGRLDVLCEIGNQQGYEELLSHSVEIHVGSGSLRLLDLPTLIEIKTAAGRLKDRMVVPVLIATLEERKKRSG